MFNVEIRILYREKNEGTYENYDQSFTIIIGNVF